MAKLKIFTFPDLVLTQKALPIERVDRSLYSLADHMLETMYEAPGVGLAANQVGILDRILVIDIDYDFEESPEGIQSSMIQHKNPKIVINPEIIYREGSFTFKEGCLSVPEYSADVKRSKKIQLKYQDIDGLTQTLSAEDLLAVVIQHEIDHLEGKLFIDRLSPLKKEIVKKKLRKERNDRDLGSSSEKNGESSLKKKRKKDF